MKFTDLNAYEILEQRPLEDLHSEGCILRHKKSGARIAVISNDDDNKVFYVGFRTPPEDSTGVPHIIEHTVLCGSEKYPVKDPFVELVKGSLNTFLNAMTYPEKTIYPVASCNDKDFQNLMSVYMDAVFHPNIYKYEEIFKQEGWHYELEDEESPITINGVVYNEMKGAFSSADDVLQRQILNSLFPDTTYSNESGGDPECIPDLTYEEYLNFHRRYYHPCNSYIYLYGDMDVTEKLRWMDEEYLSHYEKIEIDSEIRMQKPFEKPIEICKKYPISSTESEEDNTYLSYNMVIGTALDKKLYLAFDVLDYALVSAPGAPLKKALLDAGIGKDISGGYDSSTMQPVFSIIAKNANTSQKEQFLSVIREVLEQQVKQGIDKKALLAGINGSEFRYREADFGQFPKGLLYGIQCLDSWLYDDMQPFMHLEAVETYRFLKEQVKTDYFEQLISKYLLENTHASVVIVEPEKGLNAKKEEALEKKLAAYKASLSKEELQQLVADTKHLKEYQEEPSPKEDLEKIPMLERKDIKREAAPLYNEKKVSNGTTIVHHSMFSNGIAYLRLLFDIRDFAVEDLPYVGLLKSVLGFVDTKNYDYANLANEINIHTGGIAGSFSVYPHMEGEDYMQVTFEVRTKVLMEELPEAVKLVGEIIRDSKISDEKRLQEILGQLKSRLQAALSGSGHSAASLRAMSYFSRPAYYQDATAGILFYQMIADVEEHFDEKKTALIAKLEELVERIFTPDRMTVSVTCEEKDYGKVEQEIGHLKEYLYPVKETGKRVLPKLSFEKKNEGFMDASQVQYVARAGNFARHGYSYHGALRILKVIMGYDYLWINIRVKGGAYGCMNSYMRNGDTYFVSYRDPNLEKTNEVYDHIPEYLENFTADERDMTKYIIGTISDMDTPMNPNAKGARSMTALLQGITMEDIQRERDEVLNATEENIRGLKDMISSVLEEKNLCVIGNEECLENQKQMFTQLKNLY
ncbi:MAG: insulinase family protein [Clostridiales bacterium]|nr:insulinase family protein [Clostridiales bacterium]